MAAPPDFRPSGLQAAIIAASIRFRGVVIALAALVIAYGLYNLHDARYDVFPEFAPPQVSVQTEAPGLSPEQVEALVTTPIETAIDGVPGTTQVLSSSIQGLSLVTVYFGAASDIYRDRQLVAERLAVAAQRLPQGVTAPTMTPLTSSTQIVLVAGLTSKTQSLMALKTIADWTIRPRLLAVPGVADVTVFGRDTRSLQIQIRPDALVRFHLGFSDVVATARKATGVRGAGYIETANQRVLIQSEGQSLTPAEIGQTVILAHGGGRVTLADVADVREAPEPAFGAAAVNGRPGVVLNVEAQYGANTIEVTRGVEAAFADLRPDLKAQGVTLHGRLFRPADFIATAMSNIRRSLYIGGALVIAVLTLFLFNLGAAVIAITAIPLSLLAGVVVLGWLGGTLNTMTLGGLAIAVGVVVDDAVIDVENTVRRLRENRLLAHPAPVAAVILRAAIEVRGPVIHGTFAVLLVFVPILLLPGVSGALFAPLGVSYSLAVSASLLVALTLVPALGMTLLARQSGTESPPAIRWARTRYEGLLLRIGRRPRTVIALTALFTILGLSTLPFFSGSFIPDLSEGHFIVHMSSVPGTSLDHSLAVGARVAKALLKIPGVRSVAQRTGRAELAADVYGPNYSELEVDLLAGLSGDDQENVQSSMRAALSQFVGVAFSIKTFLSERIDETVSGSTAAVAVNIFGNDLNVLEMTAQEVAQVVKGAPGVIEVTVQSPPGLPQLTIRLRKSELLRWGLTPVEVLDAVRAAYAGEVVGQMYEGDRVFNVMLTLDLRDRKSLSEVGRLPLRTSEGTLVPLSEVADIFEANGRYQITHHNGRRTAGVTFNIAGRSTSTVVREVRRRIAGGISLPPGVYIQYAGNAEAAAQARRRLILDSAMAGVGVVLLLSIVTRNWRNLALVLANLPFAIVGGVLAVFGTGGFLSLGSMVGFVTVFGITIRNSILIISHYERLVAVEGMTWGPELAIRGAGDRLSSILMTSLVAGLGLLPLAIGGGAPGQEIEGPMAIVILGGLLTSMALNLLVLPTLALRFGRFEPRRDEFAAQE